MDGLALDLRAGGRIHDPGPSGLTRALGGFSSEADSVPPLEWDRFVAAFDDLNLFQTAAYADGLRGEGRMSHLLLRRDAVVVAGARVAIMTPPGCPIGIAYVKYGPFWRRAASPPDENVYKAVVAAIVGEYAGRRGHMITISPRPHPQFQPIEERWLQELGFAGRPQPKRPISLFLVNTGAGEKALRASLAQTWRHNLNRAERNELDISFRDPMEALADFLALHEAMIARKKFVEREPLHVLPRIFQQLPPACSRIVTASHQGEVVAGAVIIIAGDVGYYLYGASADAALSLRAGYALHWRIAGWLAERDVRWYDLGDGFGGLRQFKQGFVGKSGAVLSASEFDRWVNPQARIVGRAIYGARDLVARLRSCRRWVQKKTALFRAGKPG
jgi:hypothetical protein